MNAKIHIILDVLDYLFKEVSDYIFREVSDYILEKCSIISLGKCPIISSLREHLIIINISFQSGKIAIDEKRRH